MTAPLHTDSDVAKMAGLGVRTNQLERRPAIAPPGGGIQLNTPEHYGEDYNLGQYLDIETYGNMDFFAGDTAGIGHVDFTVKSYFNIVAYDGFTVDTNGGDVGIGLETSDLGSISLLCAAGGDIVLNAASGGGNIVLQSLPTSAAGLPTGAIWNNGGVLNIA